jgi:hypothetical protein
MLQRALADRPEQAPPQRGVCPSCGYGPVIALPPPQAVGFAACVRSLEAQRVLYLAYASQPHRGEEQRQQMREHALTLAGAIMELQKLSAPQFDVPLPKQSG